MASDNGIVIAASKTGKLKTISQMVMVVLVIADLGGIFSVLEQIFIWLALILTVLSLIEYIYNNKNVLSMQG